MAKTPITPKAKVADVLEAHPELEDVLIATTPMFRKLRNPVLRKTIARITSLERAAEIAGLPPRELVIRLREAAGIEVGDDDLPDADQVVDSDERPAPWVDAARVVWTIDADQLLASEQQPISAVQSRAAALEADDLGLVRSSFRPAPLIELLGGQGYRVAVVRSGGGYATFVGRG